MRVAICGQKVNKQTVEDFIKVLTILADFEWKVVLEEDLKQQLISKAGISDTYEIFKNHKDFNTGIDLAISMGGDGTFLKTVSYIRNSGVPIIGINTGRLGFLANISKDQIFEALSQVREKKYEFERRSLLRVLTDDDLFGDDNFALNELTLYKKDTSSMITVHASLDNK
ncbi:MAG: NAD(+) kinase, partial [Crocinitomicaceae bacterium]|nr:NAD(+) kinase [Crocinitomicaceae bacterium]